VFYDFYYQDEVLLLLFGLCGAKALLAPVGSSSKTFFRFFHLSFTVSGSSTGPPVGERFEFELNTTPPKVPLHSALLPSSLSPSLVRNQATVGACMRGGEHGALGSTHEEDRRREMSLRSLGGPCPDPQTTTGYHWISINLFTRMRRHLA
jgi:hypothetical protein